MNVHLPSVSTPNRPSAAESRRRWSDSCRSRTWSSVSAWMRTARRTKTTPVAASRAASAPFTTRSSRSVWRDASPSCAENLLSSCVRRLLRWSAWPRISDAALASTSPRSTRSRKRSASSRICWMTTSASVQVTIASAMKGTPRNQLNRRISRPMSSGWLPPCRKPSRATARSGSGRCSSSRAMRSPRGTASACWKCR